MFKLFVWRNILCVYDYGIIVDSATTEEEARQKALQDSTSRYKETGQSPEGLQRLVEALTKPADEVRALTNADIVGAIMRGPLL